MSGPYEERLVGTAFDRAAKSLGRVLGVSFDDSSQLGLLELVLDGAVVVELHAQVGRAYLVAVLSEDEELSFDAPIFHRLLDETEVGQTGGCVVAYEADRQRLIAWREVPLRDVPTDPALDIAVQEILRVLEACVIKLNPLFQILRAGRSQGSSPDFARMN